ncbi:MAG: FAD/NAD(P)-binding protein [archaeon]
MARKTLKRSVAKAKPLEGKPCKEKNQSDGPLTGNPYVPDAYKVLDFHRETHDTFTITVDMTAHYDPGQFVQVSIPGIGEAPISICSYAPGKHMQLNVRQVGNVTNALANIKKGDTILLRGPYGKGYPMHHFEGDHLVIIGGGCGVAPLKGVIDYVTANRDKHKEVTMLLGYRSPDDIIFARELKDWQKQYDVRLSVDKNSHGAFCYNAKTGFITELLKEANLNNRNKVVFICGPPIMMRFVTDILHEQGFHDDQIYVSAERLMYCAFGICCHCMIRGKYTCVDGPVFRYDEIKHLTND